MIDLNSPPHLYDVILADPPWRYDFSPTNSRKIENQYPTMTLDEIKALHIPAKPNSVCYLWATVPKLLEGLDVLQAWGFTYKSHMCWDKQKIGMGYWFRGQHELLLVGTKGKFSPPAPTDRKPSILRVERQKHSQKPFVIRRWIKQWFPNMRYLEMFARDSEAGFDVWGNQAP